MELAALLHATRRNATRRILSKRCHCVVTNHQMTNSRLNPTAWIMLVALLGATNTAAAATDSITCSPHCRCLEGNVVLCHSGNLVHVPSLRPNTVVVDLDHNRISILTNRSFSLSPLIDVLSMEYNGLMQVDPDVFTIHTQLRILRLGHNQLVNLPATLFSKAHRLEVLDLQFNRFSGNIPHELMLPLESLQDLNLSHNQFTSPVLGSGFRATTQLASLDISHNYFLSLEPDTFGSSRSWDATKHHYVNLSNCNIRHIHPRSFARISRINGMSLAGNPKIPGDELQAALGDLESSSLTSLDLSALNLSTILTFFNSFHHEQLSHLTLSFNNIAVIPRRAFLYLINLRTLDLSSNRITSITDLTGLSRLEELKLSHNQLSSLRDTTFEGLHEIRTLDLSGNFLNRLEGGTFLDLFNLQTLDVSDNTISDISISSGLETLQVIKAAGNLIMDADFLKRLPHLQSADLSRNLIRRLGPNLFSTSQELNMVNFSGNAMFEIDSTAFENASPKEIDLSHNRLKVLSHSGWNHVRRLRLNDNRISNVTADAFQGLLALEALYMQRNNLYMFEASTFDNLHNLRFLDLSDNPLGSFMQSANGVKAINAVESLEILHLSEIDLRHFPFGLFSDLTSLLRLNLSRNSLEDLHGSSLSSLPRLTFVDLAYNLLTSPQPRHFLSNSLAGIDFSGNPLRCNCDTQSLINWLHSTKLNIVNIHDSALYQCVAPLEWKGVPLIEFHLDDTTCSYHEKAIIFIAIGCTVMALILLVTLAVFRYKWWYRRKQAQTRYSFIDDTLTSGTGSFSMSGSATSNDSNVVANRHSRDWV